MRVIVDPLLFTESSHGPAWGAIWIEDGSRCFPQKNWSDMVLAVLIGWLEATDRFITKNLEQERLFFMDGPFEMEILRKDEEILFLSFVNNSARDVKSLAIGQVAFLECILHASGEAIEACHQKGFASRDLDRLVQLVNELRHPQ